MTTLGQHLTDTWAETLEHCVLCVMSRGDVSRLSLSDSRIVTRIAKALAAMASEDRPPDTRTARRRHTGSGFHLDTMMRGWARATFGHNLIR